MDHTHIVHTDQGVVLRDTKMVDTMILGENRDCLVEEEHTPQDHSKVHFEGEYGLTAEDRD